MRAVVKETKASADVGVKQVPLPVPKAGELLIRVEATPINPSDQITIQGNYKSLVLPDPPFTVGFEGAGVVVDVGEGVDKEEWMNKRISFVQPGSWAEYVCLAEAYPMKVQMSDTVKGIDVASFWVNPMTVMGMYDLARKAGATVIAHNAGASSLGRQLIRLSQKKGFERRRSKLKAMGAKYIINMSKEGWLKEYHDVTHKLGVTILFDAIGGEEACEFLDQMPPKSTLYNYGVLSGKPLSGFTADTFIFQGKTVTGFNLGAHMREMTPLEIKDYCGTVAEDLNTGGAIFGSTVAKTFPLEQFKEAIEYANAHTLEGKVYLIPGDKP